MCLSFHARAIKTATIVTKFGLDYSAAVSAVSILHEFHCRTFGGLTDRSNYGEMILLHSYNREILLLKS